MVSVKVSADLRDGNPGIENTPFVFAFELENTTGISVNGLRFNYQFGSGDENNISIHPSSFPSVDIIASGASSSITWSDLDVALNERINVGGSNPGLPRNNSDCCAIDYRPDLTSIEWLVDGVEVDADSGKNGFNLVEPWFGRGAVEPKAVRVTYFDYKGGLENPEVLGKAWYMGTGSFLFEFYNSTNENIYFSYATADPDTLITDKILSDSLFDFSDESDVFKIDANGSDIRPWDGTPPTVIPLPPSLLFFGSGILGLFRYQLRWERKA